MDLKEAFQIVIDLAADNILGEPEAKQDPEILMPEKERQELAIKLVTGTVRGMSFAGLLDEVVVEMGVCECKDPLFGLEATKRRAEQLSKNFNWMMEQIDAMHSILCVENIFATWQERVAQVVEKVKEESMEKFGKVSWCFEDILELKPEWTKEKCEDFLSKISSDLSQVQVEQGWHFIDVSIADVEG